VHKKAKIALRAVKCQKTDNKFAQEYVVYPTQIGQWKKALLINAGQIFDVKGNRSIDP